MWKTHSQAQGRGSGLLHRGRERGQAFQEHRNPGRDQAASLCELQSKSRKVANAEVEVPHTEITEALAEALDIAEAEGQPVHELAEAVANGSEISVTMDGPEMTIETVEPENTVVSFNVTGEERKALVEAISAHLGIRHIYQNAPTFAYVIGDYRVDKVGTLTGPANEPLVAALHAKGFDEDK